MAITTWPHAIDDALLLLSLHVVQPALLPELDCNNLLPLIAVIPESVFSSQLAPWLTENIVPFILQYMAELMVTWSL